MNFIAPLQEATKTGLSLLFICLAIPAATTAAENPSEIASRSVDIPLRIAYPLLETFLVSEVFTGPGQTLSLPASLNACSEITLSEPVLSARPDSRQRRFRRCGLLHHDVRFRRAPRTEGRTRDS